MLQKTFEINSGVPQPYLLNVEIGSTFIALNSFNASGQPGAQFELFNFLATDNWTEIWTAVAAQSAILGAEGGLNFFEKVQIIWENDLVQTIPNTFWQPELAADYMAYHKGSLYNQTQLFTTTEEYTFLYTVPKERYDLIHEQLPDAAHQHKYSGVVAKINQFSAPYPLQILLIFYQDHFIICAIREGRLQVINTHYFENGTAIIYHLLNTIRQLGAELTQTCVYLSGLIDGDSALYREIYKFVPIIDVDQLDGAGFLSESDTYPSHFFVPFYKYS